MLLKIELSSSRIFLWNGKQKVYSRQPLSFLKDAHVNKKDGECISSEHILTKIIRWFGHAKVKMGGQSNVKVKWLWEED